MAKKNTKISINALEEAVGKLGGDRIKTIEWNGLNIEVKTFLTLEETMIFVTNVVDVVFDSDLGSYTPEVKDFLISTEILEQYTNLTLPASVAKSYELVYRCNELISIILGVVNEPQFHTIIDAIDEKISYMIQTNGNAVNKQAEELVASMGSLRDGMSEILSNVTAEDVENMTKSLLNGKIDEKKLVDAVLENKEKKAELKPIGPAQSKLRPRDEIPPRPKPKLEEK